MIIWSSINCPTVICLPTICYFSREKPLVKPMAPGSSSSYICLAIYFSFEFLFRYIKPKIQKYIAALLFTLLLFVFLSIYLSLQDLILAINHQGIDNPCLRRVQVFVILCVGAANELLRYCPTGLITSEKNTYLYCTASSPPLRGNPNAAHK